MTEPTTDAIVVMITAANPAEASTIAELLIEKRVAACVQILPAIESVYRWKGAIERSPETLLLAKTTRDRFAALETAVRSVHSYETPEIIALEVSKASIPYLDWLVDSVRE